MGTEKSTLAIEIGRRIAERRKRLGLTQAQAAEKAGLTQQFSLALKQVQKIFAQKALLRCLGR